jgi:hypothetical protein
MLATQQKRTRLTIEEGEIRGCCLALRGGGCAGRARLRVSPCRPLLLRAVSAPCCRRREDHYAALPTRQTAAS